MGTRNYILTAFFLGAVAQASDFSGYWTGPGTITRKDIFTGTQTSPCAQVEIYIEHLPTQMTIQRYHAHCDLLDSDWGPHVMEIRDTVVFEDDEESGTFENDLLKTLTASGGVQYAFNLRLISPAADDATAVPLMESYYGVKNLMGAIVIEANLNAAEAP